MRSYVKHLEGLRKIICIANIEDGVCLPASDGFLGRHVSTSRRSRGIGS
ncbi:hypothetical protein GBAR_LOCUS28517 [Geodia barretti]|uniref:Uncharacterized protein n=1 Tax=Geodia barretti TaxID=519541 RepID=A0AA35TS42_GEOBA|nr:hypothetical protein GBAR_LOCUS28517 [Geodia barretti]